MAVPMKPSEARTIINVLGNPELANTLSIKQVAELNKKLTSYNTYQQGQLDRFVSEGMSEEQAMSLLKQQNAAIEDGSYVRGGKMPAQGPTGAAAQVHGVARAINAGAEGVWRAVEGLGGMVGVLLNIHDPEDAKKYRETIGTMRFERARDDIETFGRVNDNWMQIVGESVPWMATAGVGAQGGLLRYSLSQGMVGGMAGVASLSDDPLEERRMDFAIGAGLGAAFGGIFGLPQYGKSVIAKNMVNKLNKETATANVELERAVQEMVDNGDFGFSFSQVTGDRFFFGLEARAATDVQKTRQNNNIQTLFDHILKRADEMSGRGMSADEIGYALRDSLENANKSIHEAASRDFGQMLEYVQDTYGTKIVMSQKGGQDYLFKLDEILADASDVLNPGGKVSNDFVKYRNEIDRFVNPNKIQRRTVKGKDGKNRYVYDILNRRTGELDKVGLKRSDAMGESMLRNEQMDGGLTANEIRRIQKGLNNLLSGKTAVFDSPNPNTNRNMARGLMSNFFENLEANAANPQAVKDLLDMSTAYKAQMLKIDKIEKLMVSRVFGLKDMPTDPEEALDRVIGASKSSLEETRKFLEDWDPTLLGELQSTMYRRVLSKAGDPTLPNVDVPIALDKFATALSGKGPNGEVVGQLGRGLLDPAMQKEMVTTAKALRTIKNLYFTGISPGGTTIDDLAINVVSRSPEFMSRFLTRALTTGKGMDAVLTDPLLRQAIVTIAENGPRSRTGNAAMLVLTNWITQQDAESARAARAKDEQNAVRLQGQK